MSSGSSIVSDLLTVISDAATYLYTAVLSPFSSDVSSSEPVISDADTVLSSVVYPGRSIVAGHLVAILIAAVCATVHIIISIIEGHISKVRNTGDPSTQAPVRIRKFVCGLFDNEELDKMPRKRTNAKATKRFYTCGICGKNAPELCVQCSSCKKWIRSSCKKWFHYRCGGIDEEQMVILTGASAEYYCRECTEDASENFDYQGSIDRLGAAAKQRTNPMATLLVAANVETILLQRTKLPPAPKDLMYTAQIDYVSMSYLEESGVAASKIPLSTTGDGNCLFNAISLSLYGHERHATEIRVRTCIELIKNEKWYSEEYGAAEILKLVSPDMKNACLDTAIKGQYSSAFTIAAAASAIGVSITSIYPPRNGMLDRTLFILNRTFSPREPATSHRGECFIMWTNCGGDTGKTWIPDHFVPLVAKKKHKPTVNYPIS
ncbi:Uncharacterised protein g7464 [Pycnogonum litorale]